MSFPKYPAYKDSGVEWLGEVPAHWSANPLKRAFKIEGGSTPTPDEANWDGDIAWVTPADLSGLSTLFLGASKRTITLTGLASCGTTLLPAGSLILSTRAPIGSLAIALTRMCTNQGCKGLVPYVDASSTYYAYVLLTAKAELNNRGKGTTFLEISGDELGRFVVPAPPFPEQTQIARFLDHETARIDALIEEQQRLIELLKEKRQAVISHAVTKGLDPTVPMKDSGVEWLGEVPAHWNVGTLRWYATIQGGVAKGKDYEGRETVVMPYLRVANVQNGYVDLAEVKEIAVLESEVERYRLRAGDVLMNEGGDNDKLGRGTVWQAQIDPCLHQNHVFAIRPNGLLRAEWLAAFTQAEQARTYFYLNSKQSTNLASISASNVMSLALPIPSEKEQLEILTYLEADRIRHEELTAVAVSTVELLQERRSALISAAVTGKIDVRGWQPPASAKASEHTTQMTA